MTALRKVGDAQPGVFNLEQPVWSVRGVRGWEAWNEPQNLRSTGAVGRARAGHGQGHSQPASLEPRKERFLVGHAQPPTLIIAAIS